MFGWSGAFAIFPFSSGSPSSACWPMRLLMATTSHTTCDVRDSSRSCAGGSALNPGLGPWGRRCRWTWDSPNDAGASVVLLRVGLRIVPTQLCMPRDAGCPCCELVSAICAGGASLCACARAPRLREHLPFGAFYRYARNATAAQDPPQVTLETRLWGGQDGCRVAWVSPIFRMLPPQCPRRVLCLDMCA